MLSETTAPHEMPHSSTAAKAGDSLKPKSRFLLSEKLCLLEGTNISSVFRNIDSLFNNLKSNVANTEESKKHTAHFITKAREQPNNYLVRVRATFLPRVQKVLTECMDDSN